jgi:hypothetical protein
LYVENNSCHALFITFTRIELTFTTQAILWDQFQKTANHIALQAIIDTDLLRPFRLLRNIENFALHIEDVNDYGRSGFRLPDGEVGEAIQELKAVVEENLQHKAIPPGTGNSLVSVVPVLILWSK